MGGKRGASTVKRGASAALPPSKAMVRSPKIGVMKFQVLGPLEVTDNGYELSIRGRKLQALVALLLLHAGETVSRDRLIEELWGDDPPATAAKTLQAHVSRLRRELGDAIVTRGGGYAIEVPPHELDLHHFEELFAEGREALANRRPTEAESRLREALDLWRGPPLPELAGEPFAQVEIGRLEQIRLDALEDHAEAELSLGRHAQAIETLEGLVARHPYRERLRALLMLALYRSGRQADALDLYRETRRVLVDSLGIEPGPQLRELHEAILAQDPALDGASNGRLAAPPAEAAPRADRAVPAEAVPAGTPSTAPSPTSRRRQLALPAAGIVAMLVAAGALLVALIGDDEAAPSPLTNDSHAVAVIDPDTNEVTKAASVGTNPGPLAYEPESRSLWVGNLDDRSVTRIDLRPVKTGRTVAVPERPLDLAAGNGVVWVAGASRAKPYVTARRIDPRFDASGGATHVQSLPGGEASVALAGRTLWVAPSAGLLTRLDAVSGETRGAGIDATPTPTTIAAGRDAVWLGDTGGGSVVSRVDSRTGVAKQMPVAADPAGIAVGAGAVWVTLGEDTVARMDPATGTVRGTTPVGERPAGIAVGAGGVWVANSGDGTVSRLDPKSGRVTNTIQVGASPQDVVVADGRVWVSVRPSSPVLEGDPGGTIRIAADEVDSLDPALGYDSVSFPIFHTTGAKLLDYTGVPGVGGARLVPELAEALPRRSDGGRTYTFTIRRGFRFSPPSGEPVTARSMKYTIERTLNPRMQSPAGGLVSDLVGGAAYAEGRARHISGVRASGNTLTLRLVDSSSTLPDRIALPFFCAVPVGTPIDPEGLRKVPSAGPYYVASHIPDEEVVLRRNPNYGGSRRRGANELRFALGGSLKKAIAGIEAGTVDYVSIDADRGTVARRLEERYGADTASAKPGGPRYVVKPILELDQLMFNTSRPPFSSARLRRAVNYALDRRLLARESLWNGLPAQPTDQYLPPSMSGFRDARIYPSRPDIRRARRLAGPGRRSVVLYTAGYPSHLRFAQIVRLNLRAIGMDVEIKDLGPQRHWTRIGRRGEPFDMAITAWMSDYPDPTDFLNQLDGRTIRAEGNDNFAYFDDPAYNRRLEAAESLPSPARELALGKLDVDTARTAAPWAAVAVGRNHDFFSARVGCQRFTAVYGVDLASLCVRRD
jgi:YVTN family beta-propeller protein